MNLSTLQQRIVLAGLLSVGALCLWVPWTHGQGYSYIFRPPHPVAHVDVVRVLIPVGLAVLATAVFVVLAGPRNPSADSPSSEPHPFKGDNPNVDKGQEYKSESTRLAAPVPGTESQSALQSTQSMIFNRDGVYYIRISNKTLVICVCVLLVACNGILWAIYK